MVALAPTEPRYWGPSPQSKHRSPRRAGSRPNAICRKVGKSDQAVSTCGSTSPAFPVGDAAISGVSSGPPWVMRQPTVGMSLFGLSLLAELLAALCWLDGFIAFVLVAQPWRLVTRRAVAPSD